MLIFAFAALLAARLPGVFRLGRFWAEEGAVYFRNAWNERWYDALFAVHTGYINLPASLATLLSIHLAPVADLPFVTSAFALLVQVCPAILLATAGIAWLRPPLALAAAFLLIAVPPHMEEVWLNSITSQFHLALCAALILALPTCGGLVGLFRGALLPFAGLSGPASAFLLPLFALRTVIDRSPARALQTALLGAAVTVEMLMVWLHPEPGRSLGLGPRMLLLIVYVKHLVVPFLGLFAARQASAQVVSDVANGVTPWLAYAVTVAAAAAIAAGVVLARRREVAWLFVAAVAIMALSYFGALGPHTALIGPDFGMRYAYVPCVLFGLTLLGIATNTRRVARTIATMLVAWLIVVGLASYFVPSRQFASGPAWGDEVAKWRADPGYAIQLWPAVPSWKRELGPPPGINGRPD